MELKIRIKEVKEEERQLTIEEQWMYTLTRIDYISDTLSEEFMSAVQKHLNEIGLIDVIPKPYANWGLFRTETIRDATPEEIIAWHCTQIWKLCDTTGGECFANCPKRGWCEATVDYTCEATFDYNKSMTILEGKEVILEVI